MVVLARVKDHQKLLDNYLEHLRRRGKTVLSPYSTYAERFIKFAEARNLDKRTVEDFLASCEDSKSSTRRFAFGVVRTMFNVNQVPWPFRKGEGPKNTHDTYAPAYDPRAVAVMIEAARQGKLDPDEAFVLAMVSTYGMRREEVTRLKKGCVANNLLTIPTAKGEAPRLHLIPAEIKPYIDAWGFKAELTITQLELMWYRLEIKAGLKHSRKVGWHSLRRTLNTLLMDRISHPQFVRSFMGWASRSQEMEQRYYKTEYVGYEDKPKTVQTTWRREIDEEIFVKHPFLPLWRGKKLEDF